MRYLCTLLALSVPHRQRINLIRTINVWQSAKCLGTFSACHNEESPDIKAQDEGRRELR